MNAKIFYAKSKVEQTNAVFMAIECKADEAGDQASIVVLKKTSELQTRMEALKTEPKTNATRIEVDGWV